MREIRPPHIGIRKTSAAQVRTPEISPFEIRRRLLWFLGLLRTNRQCIGYRRGFGFFDPAGCGNGSAPYRLDGRRGELPGAPWLVGGGIGGRHRRLRSDGAFIFLGDIGIRARSERHQARPDKNNYGKGNRDSAGFQHGIESSRHERRQSADNRVGGKPQALVARKKGGAALSTAEMSAKIVCRFTTGAPIVRGALHTGLVENLDNV